jgi:catechol-2,3-dioxygenase
MSITRLNHAVLYVRDAARSAEFYCDLFEMDPIDVPIPREAGAFLRLRASDNDHDLALFTMGPGAQSSDAGQRTVGLYHLAWQVERIEDLLPFRDKLHAIGSYVGATDHGTTKSLYGKDPDGIEFEIMWMIPAELIGPDDGPKPNAPLNLEKEIARFGTAQPA